MVSGEMYLAVHVCMHLCTSPYPCDPTYAIRIFMTVVVVSQVQSLKRELSAKALQQGFCKSSLEVVHAFDFVVEDADEDAGPPDLVWPDSDSDDEDYPHAQLSDAPPAA